MIKKILLLSLLFLFCVILFAIATFPAQLAWQHLISPKVNARAFGVEVLQVDGTVWNGRAHTRYQGVGMISDWRFDWSGLLQGSLPLYLDLDSHAGQANVEVQATMDGRLIARIPKADVLLNTINPALRRNRLTLDGEAMIRNLAVEWADQRVVSASGSFSWTGGDIAYPAGRQTHERTLPPFRGQIETVADGDIQLHIQDNDADFPVIEGLLTPEGLAELQVRRRVLDLANEPWSSRSTEKDVVFRVRKPLF